MNSPSRRQTMVGEAWSNVLSGRNAGGIYGLLIALSVVTALSLKEHPDPAIMAAAVAGSGLVFWIAHIHAHLVAEWIRTDERPSWTRIRAEAVEQLPLLVAAMPAAVILTAADRGPLGTAAAVWTVVAISLAALAAWGVTIARAARLGIAGGALIACINVAMGLLIVTLKVFFSH